VHPVYATADAAFMVYFPLSNSSSIPLWVLTRFCILFFIYLFLACVELLSSLRSGAFVCLLSLSHSAGDDEFVTAFGKSKIHYALVCYRLPSRPVPYLFFSPLTHP
jgi:hypothetical protein